MAKANRNILDEIRKKKDARKKEGDAPKEEIGYGYLRLPEQQIEDFGILKLAYEIMWSKGGNPSELSIEELEDWELEHMTMEEFFIRLYDGALRIDPKVKDYIAMASDAYHARERFSGTAREATKKAVRSLALTAKMNGTAIMEEAVKAKEEAAKNLQADILGSQESGLSPKAPHDSTQVDPSSNEPEPPITDSESAQDVEAEGKKRCELKYFYVKGDERIPARFSKGPGSFAADFEGRARGFTFFSNNGWHLEDELGNVVDEKTAARIKEEHEEERKREIERVNSPAQVLESSDLFAAEQTIDNYQDSNMPPISQHSYMFVGPDGEFEALNGTWGIICYKDDEELTANEMFNQGYKLVRDDGKEFTSLSIRIESVSDHTLIDATAFRLTEFDTQ